MESTMRPVARNCLIYGVLVVLTSALAGCGDLGQFDRYREDFLIEKPFEPNGRIEVENFNGSVDIASWPRNSLQVSGTKSGPSHRQIDEIKVNVRVDNGVAFIYVQKPSGGWTGGYGAQLRIRVPKLTTVGKVKSSNGGITLGDLDGAGDVHSTNGRVLLVRVNGNYEVETTNGGVEVDACQGVFHLRTTNGPVRGTLSAGSVTAETSNGSIDLTVRHTKPGDSMRFQTRNGSVTLSLGEMNNNAVDAETTNGSINLRLPESADAQLQADTSSGSVKSDLPVEAGQVSRHTLIGRLGKGGPIIQLHSRTGSVRIQRY
jgi:hypothetical protein